ncbi:MAG: hypothetical protein WBZ20_13570, partial [Nitrososphaeraceae archaeon]
ILNKTTMTMYLIIVVLLQLHQYHLPVLPPTSTKPYQNYYYNKYHEGLLELAKGFLKLLLNQLVDKTMVTAVKADEK